MRDFLKLALVLLGVCLVLAIKDVGAANATCKYTFLKLY